jgi:ABC-type multidrug transport system fused ATPase/permease subunit
MKKENILTITLINFSKTEKIKIGISIIIQFFLSLIDLVGVGIIGVLGALAVTGIESNKPGNKVGYVLKILHFYNFRFQEQMLALGLLAALILIVRTVASVLLLQKTLLFISRRGATISSNLAQNLFLGSASKLKKYTEQEILYATTNGAQLITLGILGNAITMMSDISLMLVMSIGLLVVDPIMSILVFILFSVIGYGLYKLMRKKITSIGLSEVDYTVESNQLIMEFLNTFKEILVQNLRSIYVSRFSDLRFKLAKLQSQRTFLPNISKYVVESTVVIGSLVICGVEFKFKDARHAVGSLSIFLAAGTRIAPAVLRVQQSAITIKSSAATLGKTLEMLADTNDTSFDIADYQKPKFSYDGFVPKVKMTNVNFSYDGSDYTLRNINLEIDIGEKVAIVGPSGSGKSTLVDIMLGITNPGSGTVEISNLTSWEAFSKWNGAISYVPQNIAIIKGSIKDNISLGLENNDLPDGLFWDALKKAQLDDFVRSLPNGLDENVGDQGSKLSGGQRQRLGIARSLFTNPKMIVFDEATSALDVDTESAISNFLSNSQNGTTIIMIAHRLSSVRNAGRIIYLDKGSIIAEGDFDELRKRVPDFHRQANLLGM